MNRAILVIAIPAFVVSIFWLTIGWGWRTALVVGCVELAVAVGVVYYISRRNNRVPPDPRCGGVIK
jgi:Kef-type K+ transport system membrane component KefB